MKTKLLLSILLLTSLYQVKAQDNKDLMKPRPADYEYLSAPDSLGVKHIYNIANRNTLSIQNLPYPIIFIHGLNSNDKTWDAFKNSLINDFNLTFGGRISTCLDYDGSVYTSNTNFYNTSGADIALYSTVNSINIGDFYMVNFDINNSNQYYPSDFSNNFSTKSSNQSAIVKQGAALKYIIQMVLQKTGKNKVILMGHSMGGLASREYLQNITNWQNDGLPHVAKLATTGTPHGGSDAIGGQVLGVNYNSEAIRDLKKLSIYLEGGFESSVSSSYFNSDVNCNGISNDGLYVTGLNQRNIFSDIDYSCVIGNGLSILGVGGDGAVTISSANLNLANSGYSNLTQNIFSVFTTHDNLTSNWYTLMQALDEPNNFNVAYGIDYNKLYYGFNSEQSTNWSYYPTDYDDYKFTVSNNSNVSISINTLSTLNLYARIVNNNQAQVGSIYSNNGTSNISFTANNLIPGNYYLEIFGNPITNAICGYDFILNSALSTNNYDTNYSLNIFPNPTNSKVSFDNSKENFNQVLIYNYLGQEVSKINLNLLSSNQEVDLSNLSNGVYILKFSNGEMTKSVKVIKQ